MNNFQINLNGMVLAHSSLWEINPVWCELSKPNSLHISSDREMLILPPTWL